MSFFEACYKRILKWQIHLTCRRQRKKTAAGIPTAGSVLIGLYRDLPCSLLLGVAGGGVLYSLHALPCHFTLSLLFGKGLYCKSASLIYWNSNLPTSFPQRSGSSLLMGLMAEFGVCVTVARGFQKEKLDSSGDAALSGWGLSLRSPTADQRFMRLHWFIESAWAFFMLGLGQAD